MNIEDFKVGEEYEIDIEQGYERLYPGGSRAYGMSLPSGGVSKEFYDEKVAVEPIDDGIFMLYHLGDGSKVKVEKTDGYSVVFSAYDEEFKKEFSFEWSILIAYAMLKKAD